MTFRAFAFRHSLWRRASARNVSFVISSRRKIDSYRLVLYQMLVFHFPEDAAPQFLYKLTFLPPITLPDSLPNVGRVCRFSSLLPEGLTPLPPPATTVYPSPKILTFHLTWFHFVWFVVSQINLTRNVLFSQCRLRDSLRGMFPSSRTEMKFRRNYSLYNYHVTCTGKTKCAA